MIIYMQIHAYIGVFWLAFGLILHHPVCPGCYALDVPVQAQLRVMQQLA